MTCLNKPDISVPKLLSKNLAILGCYGSLRLSTTVKINKSLHSKGETFLSGTLVTVEHGMPSNTLYLARWLVVSLNDQLHAIRPDFEAIKELKDVQLTGIVRQTLNFDDTIALTDDWL